MNFPPILFNNEKFPSLLSQSHSQTSITINSFQTLCKKLLKYDNKESNFEQGIITWLKSLDISQLFKYFSFKNQWLVDILHEMILISNAKPYIKFKFIPNINSQSSEKEKEPQDTKPLISYLYFLFSNKESPKFSDYFNIVEEGFVLLSRGKSEGELRRQELVDNIRYVTLNSGNNNYNNYKEEEKDYHSEYNNVVTLSYYYLKNIDKLITTFQDISNKQCFKYPIEIETQNYLNENNNDNTSTQKNYYNFKMPKWLKDEFTFPELFCAYLEQCIIINYMYHKMYKQEISFLYYDKFDDLIDNNKKLIEFIKNSGDKKFEIIRNLRPDEIKKTISENQNIKKMICNKNTKDNDIMNSYIGNYSYSKKHTMKTIINSCIVTLEKIFIRDELDFVLFLNFFKDNIIFSTDDFAIKAIADIVNNYWKSKAAEDLLQDLDKNNNNKNNNEGNNKKKKKKRKKKKGKNEEDNNNDKNYLENNDNNDKMDNGDNNNNIEKKDENKNLNSEEEKKDNEVKKDNEENNEIVINDNNNSNNNDKNKEEIVSENKEENNIIPKIDIIEKDNENIIKENNLENINENNTAITTTENDKVHKKKKEKEFFLYPTVKDSSNKKKKNKQKGKKNATMNNEINDNINENTNQNNNIITQNIEDDKTDLSTDKATSSNTKEEEDKIIQNEIINQNINENINEKEKEKEKYKKENNKQEYDYNNSTKHKNKFNMVKNQMQFKKEMYKLPLSKKYHFRDNNNNYKYQKNDYDYNYNNSNNNYIESTTQNSEQNNNYIMGSNLPHFTSFNFHSKKKGNYRNRQGNNDNIFPYNNFLQQNIIKFSKEIIDNTIKVNNNKKLLQQLREKYIKKIYENINIILKNSKIEFQCSFYGSSVSGLAIENSDIDIMVKLRKNTEEKDYITRIMNYLVDNLKKSELNYIRKIIPISSASVPVIKLNCDLCNEPSFFDEINNLGKNTHLNYYELAKLYFDITFFETENELEKIPSELMLDYIKECTMLYPQIFDIVYIMKRFLFNRKLNKSYQGGISSYSLFLLTLAFIKSCENKYDIPIGSLFIEYLYFYSNFDFFNTIIQPSKDNNIFESKENNLENYNLNIIDPITGLNVAKSTFKIEQIQTAFRKGYDNIVYNLVDMNMNINMNNIGNISDINNNIQEQSKILDKFFSLSQ